MEALSGRDLDPYKVPAFTRCWWCKGDGPLTSEHKFKRSDLQRMQPDQGLTWVSADRAQDLISIRRGTRVRFDPSLCAKCNNDRSQPFDRAYQQFSEYVWQRSDLWRKRVLDMAQVYGPAWEEGSWRLAGYVAKHVGCRMAHERFPVPPSLRLFLDGNEDLADVRMLLFKCRDYHRFYRMSRRVGAGGGVGMTFAHGAVSPSKKRLTMYTAGLVIGYVGVMYRWEEDSAVEDSFYHRRYARLIKRHTLLAA